MKKKQIFIIVGILLALIGLVLSLVFVFLGLYGSSQSTPPTSAKDTVTGEDPIAYLKDSWHFHEGQWDRSTNTITAIRVYDLSYEEGKKVGAQVFTGDLAPETYFSQALTIAADISARFAMEEVTVVISFRSNDQGELFSVDSTGNISVCWNEEP